MRSIRLVVCGALLLSVAIAGCATAPPAPAPAPASIRTYDLGEEVTFGGLRFHLRSAEYRTSFTNWVDQETLASDAFLIVDITAVNLGTTPLPMHFQPVFRLVDGRGALYDAAVHHTMMINLQKPGRAMPGQTWNPNVAVRQEIVFDVPRGDYKLSVLVPDRAGVGFAGSTNVRGRFFHYDLQ